MHQLLSRLGPCITAWVLALGLTAGVPAQAGAQTPAIAAASSLQFALPVLIERFEADTGSRLRVTYGASGNLQRQIQQGAPFELFLSADEARARDLESLGLTQGEGRDYAIGRLVWLQAKGLPLADDARPLGGVRDAIAAFDAGQGKPRIALANPLHAPYGVAAKEVLTRADLWTASEPLRVLGENVAQAAQFALASESRGGFAAYSLVAAPTLAERADYRLIPAQWHTPINQRMVLIKGASETSTAFFDWLMGDEAGEVLERFGFSRPDVE